MSRVKVVVIRRDSSGNMIKRLIVTPKKANLVQEGLRGADHMNVTLSAEHDVQQGDEIYYMQDVLDLDNLRGMWNFYGSFRDESGFEQDDVEPSPYVIPSCVHSMVSSSSDLNFKWSGHYKFRIDSTSNDGVEIVKKFGNNDLDSNGLPTASSVPVIDLSEDFDLFLWVKIRAFNGANDTIFDDFDYSNNTGLIVQVDARSTSKTVTITVGDGTTVNSMVASSIDFDGELKLLRIKRQGGVFKLFVDNVDTTITNSSFSGDLNSTNNIHFFKKYDESLSPPAYEPGSGMYAYAVQFRYYNIALPDNEANKLFVSKAISTTMKFGGKVWKIKDNVSSKKIICTSFAKELLGTEVTSDTFSTASESFSAGARKGNVYDGDVVLNDIIGNVLKNISTDVYTYWQVEPNFTFNGDFIAKGSFLDIIKVLLTYDVDSHIFSVLPRKVLLINVESQTNYLVSDQNFNIINSGKDDTTLTNSVIVTGNIQSYVTEDQSSGIGGTANAWTSDHEMLIPPFNKKPVIDKIISIMKINPSTLVETEIFSYPSQSPVDPVAGSNVYRFNSNNSTFNFWGSDTISYYYKIKFSYFYTIGHNSKMVHYWNDDDDGSGTSVADNGLYHRNINVPQLVVGEDVLEFAEKYVNDNRIINLGVTAFTSMLVNSLNIGQKVYVYYLTKNIGSKTSNVITPISLVVRSIEYNYPASTTRIELGEYLFTGFDVEKETVDYIRNMNTSLGIVKNK